MKRTLQETKSGISACGQNMYFVCRTHDQNCRCVWKDFRGTSYKEAKPFPHTGDPCTFGSIGMRMRLKSRIALASHQD